MIIAILIILGLAFGSFVNALVWRVYQQHLPKKKRLLKSDADLSIMTGRSVCTNCKHTLAWYDLVPVLSWLCLLGKCRYCRQSISWQYPLVELVTAVLFVASYTFWPLPLELELLAVVTFGVWLVSLVLLVALVVYDIRWMLLPNRIVFPLTGLSVIHVLTRALQVDNSVSLLASAFVSLLVAGGIFYILFQLSDGRWIGGGDVKLGFALGLLLASPLLAFLMLFTASVLGLLLMLPALFLKKSSLSAKIPFGPFLIIATIIVQLFGQSIIDWYTGTFLYM